MFKEVVVSLAIIFSFLLNILYVDHPNTISYTSGFVVSLVAMSPFILYWRYRARAGAIRAAREAHEDGVDLAFLGVSEILGGRVSEGSMADLEKGLNVVEDVDVGTGSPRVVESDGILDHGLEGDKS
jgi:hypothetical protein